MKHKRSDLEGDHSQRVRPGREQVLALATNFPRYRTIPALPTANANEWFVSSSRTLPFTPSFWRGERSTIELPGSGATTLALPSWNA